VAKGRFQESDDVGRSLSADRRKTAKEKVESGYGDQGGPEAERQEAITLALRRDFSASDSRPAVVSDGRVVGPMQPNQLDLLRTDLGIRGGFGLPENLAPDREIAALLPSEIRYDAPGVGTAEVDPRLNRLKQPIEHLRRRCSRQDPTSADQQYPPRNRVDR
jgi:hypothetical protein